MCERPVAQPGDLPGVDVDADHVLALLGEGDGQREPDVAQADDPDAHDPPRSKCRDLAERLGAHVGTVAVRCVPRHRSVEARRRDPSAAPSRAARGPGSRRGAAAAPRPRRRGSAPHLEPAGPARRRCARRASRPAARPPRRAEVPRGRRVGVAGEQPLGDREVALERVEHVLPRAAPRPARAASRARRPAPRACSRRRAGRPPSRRRRSRCPRARWRAAARASRKAAAVCSWAALEAEYGSSPPSGSSSRNARPPPSLR